MFVILFDLVFSKKKSPAEISLHRAFLSICLIIYRQTTGDKHRKPIKKQLLQLVGYLSSYHVTITVQTASYLHYYEPATIASASLVLIYLF